MDIVGAFTDSLQTNCASDGSAYHFMLGIAHFVPGAISFFFLGLSWKSQEIFYAVTTVLLYIDIILNYALTGVIRDPAPIPGCGGVSASPAFFSEHAFFLYSHLQLSRYLYYYYLKQRLIVALQIWVTWTWISAVTLGYNTVEQAMLGAYVGTAAAVVLHVLVFYLFNEHYDAIMKSYIVDTVFDLKDTIFRPPRKGKLTQDQADAVIAQIETALVPTKGATHGW